MKKLIVLVAIAVISVSMLTACGGIGAEGISEDEFRKITTGMDMYAIDKIIGGHGKKISEDIDSNKTRTIVYEYQGENGGKAILTFQQEEFRYIATLTKKENIDLK